MNNHFGVFAWSDRQRITLVAQPTNWLRTGSVKRFSQQREQCDGDVMSVTFESAFPRGNAPIHTYGDLNDTAAPIVMVFMDAFGPRPALDTIAEQLASEGYRVVLPDLFYEHRPYVPLNPYSVFSGGDDRQRLSHMFGAIDQAKIDADIRALLSFCTERFGAHVPIAATGYCMGARYALSAATLNERVVLAAAFHGSNLAPESGDSAHLRFTGIKSRIYVGVADNDPTFGGAEEGRLAAALRDAKVDHMIETYVGAAHGFAMRDLPVYHPAATDRHWLRLSMLLKHSFALTGSAFWMNF